MFKLMSVWGALLLAHGAVQAAPQAEALRLEVVAKGLDRPWAVAFLPGGEFLVSERPGALRVVSARGDIGAPIAGLPAVDFAGQGGLLDVVLDRDFARSRALSLCFTEPGSGQDSGKNGTALARAKLNAAGTALEDLRVIFRQQPKMEGRHHFGCRVVESADGRQLFLTLGERYKGMQQAQTLDNHLGKVVRVDKSGQVPADNPFVRTPGALPEIYSLGHRNPQGALLDAQGQLWVHEHGPQGGDEINRVLPGRNYGWPVITYGENYGGGAIGEGLKAKPGLEQPAWQWTPSIAPSGFAQITSDAYGAAWKGSFVVGSLKFRQVQRIAAAAEEGRLGPPEVLIEDIGRVRDVRQGPDGFIYVLTEDAPGQLLRLKR
ncbi:PQQ-dependent sugar dehydrogenase [Roseateles sp. BYS180W]|uniref:PQQ-dependent sugar dehydrogenase n=1 Tax=Roseateles rivi TaxID=3299028 RepID=A0ABW7FYJ2_9BURK